jgi:small Trp-rich protein
MASRVAVEAETAMWMVWIGVILLGVKLAGIEPVASVSWWWIVLPLILAFLWFDVVEERLGFNKNKRAMDEMDKAKKERIKKGMERDKNVHLRR